MTDELMDLLHTHDKVHDVNSDMTPEELAPMLGDGDADEIVHWMENKRFKLFAESFTLPRRKKNEKAGAPYRPSNFTERFYK